MVLLNDKPVKRLLLHGGGGFFAWQFGGAILGVGLAKALHGAFGATRFAARAQGCAQIHQPLGVGGHIAGLAGQQAFGKRPQLAFKGFVGGVAVLGEDAAEHALHVAV